MPLEKCLKYRKQRHSEALRAKYAMAIITLREVAPNDLPVFFAQQLDPDANYRAAFIRRDPEDQAAFNAHWAKNMANTTNVHRVIALPKGQIAGYLVSFMMDNDARGRLLAGTRILGPRHRHRSASPIHRPAARAPLARPRRQRQSCLGARAGKMRLRGSRRGCGLRCRARRGSGRTIADAQVSAET